MEFIITSINVQQLNSVTLYWETLVKSVKKYFKQHSKEQPEGDLPLQLSVIFFLIYILEKTYFEDYPCSREVLLNPLLDSIEDESKDVGTVKMSEKNRRSYQTIRDHLEEETDGKKLQPHEYGACFADGIATWEVEKSTEPEFRKLCAEQISAFINHAQIPQWAVRWLNGDDGFAIDTIPGFDFETQLDANAVIHSANQAIGALKAILSANPEISISPDEIEELRRSMIYQLLLTITVRYDVPSQNAERRAFLQNVSAFITQFQYGGDKQILRKIQKECVDYDPVLGHTMKMKFDSCATLNKPLPWIEALGAIANLRDRMGEDLFEPIWKTLWTSFSTEKFAYLYFETQLHQ